MTAGPSDHPSGPSVVNALRFRLQALAGRRAGVRYIDYRQVEEDCELLAEKLLETYSREDIDSFDFVPIPRGGMIVLGILSYLLGLDPAQLAVRADNSSPVVVVDDVALTGARFAQALATLDDRQVIFAHLYSHPDLRTCIEASEADVVRCMSAQDLVDHVPALYPDPEQRRRWREWWLERLGGRRYWFGQTDTLVFPWSEPDLPLWNPESNEVEDGWRYAAPHRCLGNRADLGMPPRSGSDRLWVVSEGVAYVLLDEGVQMASLSSGEAFGFDGVAGDMWRALAAYGDVDAAVDRLHHLYIVERELLKSDVKTFLEELVAHGLMSPAQASDPDV